MAESFILALDQGTTSSRAILWDAEGRNRAMASREFKQIYPQPGWVEHDPIEIWESQLAVAREVIAKAKLTPKDIAAIGITNQRETAVVWERSTGRPIYNAIVWQCRRTTDICDRLKADGLDPEVRQRTGLLIDAYFTATKVRWILDRGDGAQARAERGELCFGTIDSWLMWNLTGRHVTDPSNACRTMLFNIHDMAWDDTLFGALNIPGAMAPEVKPTSGVFGETALFGGTIPVASAVGDQQAALFGQAAFEPGESKNTYGTGCFMLVNTGAKPVASQQGLLASVAWDLGGEVAYALEGSVFIAGAVVQWLRDELGLIATAAESEAVAAQVPDNGGVYLVPAFVGLGAPHWNPNARGLITGLTRGAGRAHIVRAALESISFQTADILQAMERDREAPIEVLKVDGGATANNLLMQHQADILGIPVVRGATLETTALGAAYLAGLAVGYWPGQEALRDIWREERRFEPLWTRDRAEIELNSWQKAVKTAICSA